MRREQGRENALARERWIKRLELTFTSRQGKRILTLPLMLQLRQCRSEAARRLIMQPRQKRVGL
jgi:hypothetical protein